MVRNIFDNLHNSNGKNHSVITLIMKFTLENIIHFYFNTLSTKMNLGKNKKHKITKLIFITQGTKITLCWTLKNATIMYYNIWSRKYNFETPFPYVFQYPTIEILFFLKTHTHWKPYYNRKRQPMGVKLHTFQITMLIII